MLTSRWSNQACIVEPSRCVGFISGRQTLTGKLVIVGEFQKLTKMSGDNSGKIVEFELELWSRPVLKLTYAYKMLCWYVLLHMLSKSMHRGHYFGRNVWKRQNSTVLWDWSPCLLCWAFCAVLRCSIVEHIVCYFRLCNCFVHTSVRLISILFTRPAFLPVIDDDR